MIQLFKPTTPSTVSHLLPFTVRELEKAIQSTGVTRREAMISIRHLKSGYDALTKQNKTENNKFYDTLLMLFKLLRAKI